MESYSNYPNEEEVLLPPSKLKLLEINTDFSYYHWNKLAEKKIVKKYIFEYISPLSYDINYYIKDYIKTIPEKIPENLALRGELLLSKKNWEKIKDKGANARNLVAGIINKKEANTSNL